ncbi:MAG: hypothetical protein U9R54_09980 [Bacteroidota bacterium]|nr:hypothetical protein [Bacteroidota bacterium]
MVNIKKNTNFTIEKYLLIILTMEIKGSAVKSIQEFVKNNHKSGYQKWIDSLPESSKNIMKNKIDVTKWYPLEASVIPPINSLAKLYYNNNTKQVAIETGKYSAETGLKGIYKVFLLIASPEFIINRAGRIFQSYYSPSEIIVKESSKKTVTLHITKFPTPNQTVEYRIAGWIEHALKLAKCNNVRTIITKSLTKGDNVTEIISSWN